MILRINSKACILSDNITLTKPLLTFSMVTLPMVEFLTMAL